MWIRKWRVEELYRQRDDAFALAHELQDDRDWWRRAASASEMGRAKAVRQLQELKDRTDAEFKEQENKILDLMVRIRTLENQLNKQEDRT